MNSRVEWTSSIQRSLIQHLPRTLAAALVFVGATFSVVILGVLAIGAWPVAFGLLFAYIPAALGALAGLYRLGIPE
ncbi:hypothetical protein AB0I28_28625 [Phytomonospora sp. NPDC050363]|uniref:hypothetical protein n=1 Tax=Phytomonospora sp. NPDC050363 TaxID=3155642 RepID=UPI003405BAC5